MSNVIGPTGFRPVRMIDGSPLNFQTTLLFYNSADNTGVYVGDLVVAGTQTATNNGLYLPAAKQAAAGSAGVMGVCVGVDPIMAFGGANVGLENLIRKYQPAATNGYIQVCRDPRVVFEIQLGGSTSALAIADLSGLFAADINTSVAGSTVTGNSGMSLDRTTISATLGTLPIGIIGFSQRIGNDPSSGNAFLEVHLRTVTPGNTVV